MIRDNSLFTITELSNLTGKTRPTLYKYINAYDSGDLDSVPYSFIQLFNLMERPNIRRIDVVNYCNANFINVDKDEEVNNFVKFIKENKEKIDFIKIRKIIEEEIKNGETK